MGAPYFADLPALQSPRNAMLDFAPIGDALDSLRQAGDKNAMFAHQQQREAVEDKRANASLGIQQQAATRQQQQFDQAKGEAALNHYAGITQHIQGMPPEQQPDAWKAAAPLYQRLRSTIPEFDQDAAAFGVDANDPAAVGQFIVARQTGLKDPLADQKTQADINKTNAEASWYKDRPRTNVAGATGALVDRILAANPGMQIEEAITIAHRGDVGGAAFDKERGEAAGKAAVNLPLAQASADRLTGAIDKALVDPGLSRVTGPVQNWLPNVTAKARNAQSRINEIKGGTFLQAYNDLRGGGAISDKEGEKAANAYNRLQDQGLGDDDYRAALSEFRSEVVKLYRIAQQRAADPRAGRQAAPAPTQHQTINSDADYDALPSGATFTGPDGIPRRKP